MNFSQRDNPNTRRGIGRAVFFPGAPGAVGMLVGIVLAASWVAHRPAHAVEERASIVLRVNGAPITNLAIKQRINLIMLTSPNIHKRIKAKAQRVFNASDVQNRFKRFFAKQPKPRTQAEVKAIQRRFGKSVYANARSSVRSGLRAQAISELVDDHLRLQHATKLGMRLSKEDTDDVIAGLAKDRKQSVPEFSKGLRRSGVHVKTLRRQMRARISWRRVVRARLRRTVNVRLEDIDFALASDGDAGEGKSTQLDLRQIILPAKAAYDTNQFEAARELHAKFTGCKTIAKLAKAVIGAKYRNLGRKPVASLPESARPLVAATPVGKMTPPVFLKSGIALYAVCDKREVARSGEMRRKAKRKLEDKQLVVRSRSLLKDLCVGALIEPALSTIGSARCGES